MLIEMIQDRRALHQIPELDKDLPQTVAYIQKALQGLRCTVFSPCQSSLCAFFDAGKKDAIAFRSDMDALPIQEQTGLPFASRHPGCMHACGHDAHMAILLELARRLSSRLQELPHNVLLVFQPAEETTGGAQDLCSTGVFEKYHVHAIFGLHLWPELPAGTIASRKNEFMSRSSELTVDVEGKSSHIARAEEGIDAMAACVEFYQRVKQMEQAMPPEIFRLCRFGRLESGSVRNAISAHAHLEGSLRAFQDDVFYHMLASIREIADAVAAETGCRIQVHASQGYPAVMNHAALYDEVRSKGIVFQELEKPVMISEDFSFYQQVLPGLFFFLGVGPAPALHADTFSFEEQAMEKGADFFEQIAHCC